MKTSALTLLTFLLTLCLGCSPKVEKELSFIQENTNFATAQTHLMLEKVGKATHKNFPRTTNAQGKLLVTSIYDWTPGFFPGTLWYLYELTEDSVWRAKAEEWTYQLEDIQHFKSNHDIGFMMYCSYGNAERLASRPSYKEILIQSAKSLCTRYNSTIRAIESWNSRKAWNGNYWSFPVIIDNMMNLELLCYASRASGDSTYRNLAIQHANTTLKNHFRPDHSSYHVVNYDEQTGAALHHQTCQGYSDNSTWARGQAWAVYGYTMMYRETHQPQFLEAAQQFADYFLAHLPKDLVPLWDFNAGQEGYIPDGKSYAKRFTDRQQSPRDASAAAVVCSALFELGEICGNPDYTRWAVRMLKSLASPAYRAVLGENAHFLLMHSTGSIPHQNEIDVPLTYADYYFVEALARYKRLLTTGKVITNQPE